MFLPLHLDLVARRLVRGPQPAPPPTRWAIFTRAYQLLDLPAEEPLVEPDEGGHVRGLDARAGQSHRWAFHDAILPYSTPGGPARRQRGANHIPRHPGSSQRSQVA